jgi:hypothetical protein
MFSHYEYPGKCEWIGGGLDAFVRHYNENCGTAFSLTACLDIVKISGQTPKAPEVLLTDTTTGKQMVIERKSVVWPPNYIHRHRLGHEFADAIWKKTRGRFHDAAYVLTVNTGEFEQLSRKAIQDAAESIGEIIAGIDAGNLPVRRNAPIQWSCRLAYPGEEEEDRKGLTITQQQWMSFDDPDDSEAQSGTTTEIEVQLDAAAKKFEDYSGCQMLVLLDFYGEDIFEDDIPPLLKMIEIPPVIDEVWRTICDWISPDDYGIGYECLFSRLGKLGATESTSLIL